MRKKLVRFGQICLFILIIISFIYIGTRDFNKNVIVDSERFDKEYVNVSKDNVFKYVDAVEIYSSLKSGNTVIFMGFPSNSWSGYYANILNEAAKACGIEEILYYDFYLDRENNNGTYESIVLNLANYLFTLDDDKKDIYAPTLVIVKNGEIIAFDSETSIMQGNIKPENYWTDLKSGLKYNTFVSMFNEYLK